MEDDQCGILLQWTVDMGTAVAVLGYLLRQQAFAESLSNDQSWWLDGPVLIVVAVVVCKLWWSQLPSVSNECRE